MKKSPKAHTRGSLTPDNLPYITELNGFSQQRFSKFSEFGLGVSLLTI